MTAREFADARQRLGWTLIQAAVEYNLTPPPVIEGFEDGSLKIPKAIARDIRFRSAIREREEVLAASGLPECSVKLDLDHAASGKKGRELVAAIDTLVAHVKSCALCKERKEYAEQHAPPLPEFPIPLRVRAVDWVNAFLNRLPRGVRPPAGKAGDGRRVGFAMGAALSIFACAIALLFSLNCLAHQRCEPRWWRDLSSLGFIIGAYLVGWYLAGWLWDALRPIHDRFIGYVLRFGLAGVAVYGAIVVAIAFFDSDPMSVKDSLDFLGFIGAVWAAIGVGLWVKDRFWGKLAKR